MTGHELHANLSARKARGRMLGQPADLQSVFVTTAGGFCSRRPLEAAAATINAGGRLSDYAEISPLFGFGGLPPEVDHARR